MLSFAAFQLILWIAGCVSIERMRSGAYLFGLLLVLVVVLGLYCSIIGGVSARRLLVRCTARERRLVTRASRLLLLVAATVEVATLVFDLSKLQRFWWLGLVTFSPALIVLAIPGKAPEQRANSFPL